MSPRAQPEASRGSALRASALLFLILALLKVSALDWHEIPGGRYAEAPVPKAGKTGFILIAPQTTGILFTNVVSELRGLTNQIYLNGSGVASGDVDGDGWCDLFFCGLEGRSRLYRNVGNWQFQDITESSGVLCINLDATGAAFADLDGDGDLDLIVNSLGGGTHVFFNDGKSHFAESAKNAGMNAKMGGTSLALADIDGNGTLDLYVANYRTISIRDQPETRFTMRIVDGQPRVVAVNGIGVEAPEIANRFNFSPVRGESMSYTENGEADVLYRNDGAGSFSPVSFTGGTFLDETGKPLSKPPFDWGLSVMLRDLNGDGAPDIYVCNDFKTPDRIWMNDGQGRFRALDPLAIRQTPLSSMGLDVGDLDRDGYDDILVADMLSRDHRHRFMQRIDIKPELLGIATFRNRPQSPRNTLFLNRGDGTYAEIAQFCGLEASEWTWMPVFLDVDLDGYEDILIPNGFIRDALNLDVAAEIQLLKQQKQLSPLEQMQLRKLFPKLETPKLAFHNLGNLRFEEIGTAWGFDAIAVSQGMALADLDNDGDLDLVLNNMNDPAFLFRNESAAPRLAVRLKGKAANTRGIGAKITVRGGPVTQSQEMICGGRYQSADDAMRVFAVGSLTNRLRIEVRWRSGLRSVVSEVKPNCIYEVDEAVAAVFTEPAVSPGKTQFEDVSQVLGHKHHEEAFDDFGLQPLLVNRLSQLGPGVTWADLDGDGWEDLIVGSGRGGQLAAFRNDGQGGFKAFSGAPFNERVQRDQTAILPWQRPTGERVLLVGSADYEAGLAAGGSVRSYDLSGKHVEDLIPPQPSSTGPLAMADSDGDGQLDLFVGGRVIAGKYPAPASSMLFRGSGAGFVPDAANTKVLAQVGLVSGAVFSDLNGDGQPELILACEWGPIRVFRNQQWRFQEVTEEMGLGKFLGWWNGVSTGDFDGDGRLDIIASNWGRNNKYESLRHGGPVWMYYGELAGNGFVQALPACYEPAMQKLVPVQPFDQVAAVMPFLQERIANCAAYARLSMEELYGEELKRAIVLQANWFDSTVFLNRGNTFEARSLPMEAQFAPAFSVCVGELDGDGNEDVFLSQNFFAVEPETSRYDAGRGLLLKGDGRGGFKAAPGQESGLKIYGEQRGAALCDYDGDGRLDLAVSQNAAETKLYKNVTARPGLRVRLKGPLGNPHGIGATMRLAFGTKMGPAHEIHAGSGYWSHDSVVSVLGTPTTPTQIWVRWPGGQETRSDVPPQAKEILVDSTGKLQSLR